MNSLNILGIAWTVSLIPVESMITLATCMTWGLGLIGVWTLVQLHHFINNLD